MSAEAFVVNPASGRTVKVGGRAWARALVKQNLDRGEGDMLPMLGEEQPEPKKKPMSKKAPKAPKKAPTPKPKRAKSLRETGTLKRLRSDSSDSEDSWFGRKAVSEDAQTEPSADSPPVDTLSARGPYSYYSE